MELSCSTHAVPRISGHCLGNGSAGGQTCLWSFPWTGPRADSWGLCDAGAVLCSTSSRRMLSGPPEGKGMAMGQPVDWQRARPPVLVGGWGATRGFTTSIVSQGHILQIEMPLGGLEGQPHAAGAG